MRLRAALVALLSLTALAGCTGDGGPPDRAVRPANVGFDPSSVAVTGTRLIEADVPSWDGATTLATAVRIPLTSDTLPDGSPVRWPVVVFLHGWGGSKEFFMGGRDGVPGSGGAGLGADRLEAFARAGFVAVAFDARGFGRSGGHADVAGPDTLADLGSVLDWVEARVPTSGRVGVVGTSYGGGQAYLHWAGNDRVTTAVPMYGWVDLEAGLMPNRVPKLEWGQVLYAYGLAGSKGRYDPMVHDWYRAAHVREGLDAVAAQMAERSALPRLGAVDKPLFVCQGLQETLFPQADLAWGAAGGFTRAYVYTGGHGGDAGCWERALDWMHFFLAGFDTRVDAWPALETVDARGGWSWYAEFPEPTVETLYLRAPDLATAPAGNATFTVRQSAPGLPLGASAVSDTLDGARPVLPEALRTDPSATAFTSPPFDGSRTVVGAPVLRLQVEGTPQVPFQVAALLLRIDASGGSQELGHAAFAALEPQHIEGGVATLRFEWTHAELRDGDRLQVRLGANDAGWWTPLPANYEVTFDGASSLDLPLL